MESIPFMKFDNNDSLLPIGINNSSLDRKAGNHKRHKTTNLFRKP